MAVLALCLIILFSAAVFVYRPYDGMALLSGFGGEISAIYIPGLADSAGFKVGDRILAVNGIQVDPWMQRPFYPAGLQAGDQVIYHIIRNGGTLDIPMKLGSYLDNPRLLAAILGAILLAGVFWLIGLLLCLFAPLQDVRARLIGLCWLLGGIAAAAGGPGVQSHFWGAHTTFRVSWALLGFALIASHLYFPFQSFPARWRGLLINLLAGLALIIALSEVFDDTILKPANFSLANFGLLSNQLSYAWFLGAVLVSIFLVLRSRFRSQDAEVRRQTGIILWATVLGFGPFLVLTLIPLLLFGDRAVQADGGYTSLFLVLIPMAYAYVIHQRRLLRIDAIVNRLVVFFILMISVLLASFAILGILAILLKLPPEFPLFGSLAAAVVALPSTILEKKVQVQVNRILYGTYYDHATITATLSSELTRAVDRKTLTDLLTGRLCVQMGVQQAMLYLVEGDALQRQGSKSAPAFISLDDELCQTLQGSDQPVRGNNLWALLSESAQVRWLDLDWGQLFIPIVFEEEMVGLLILGGRPSGDLYSAQDIAILGTVAHQAALAVSNIQLVDSLRGLNRRLVYTEDERRKGIASELHDSVLQDLFFIKHKVSRLQNGDEINEFFDQLIGRLRTTIQKQRPALLNASLPLALQGLVEEMDRLVGEDGPHIIWCAELPNEVKLPDPLATSVYRIAQEALTNAIKHSHARQIEVSLECLPSGLLELSIHDDGVGMKASNNGRGSKESHFGLVMMRERAAMINGELRIDSQPQQGTIVELRVAI